MAELAKADVKGAGRVLNKLNGAATVLEWTYRFFSVALVPLLIWLSATLISLDRRVTAIEANRFTAADGLEVWRELERRPTRAEVVEELRLIRADLLAHRSASESGQH